MGVPRDRDEQEFFLNFFSTIFSLSICTAIDLSRKFSRLKNLALYNSYVRMESDCIRSISPYEPNYVWFYHFIKVFCGILSMANHFFSIIIIFLRISILACICAF
jgi:hypothetical protein